MIRATIYLALFAVASGCSKPNEKAGSSAESFEALIQLIGCVRVEIDTNYPLETLDRKNYQPQSFEIANIHTTKPLDGYHGPTVGKYIFAVERYPDTAAAQRRVDEYRDLSRLANATPSDRNELSKLTVRCWAYRHLDKAYLLTTQAAMHAALEERTEYVLGNLKRHLERPDERGNRSS